MKFELLMSTMNQKDLSLLEKANINTNAIIINQSNEYKYEEIIRDKKTIKFYTFNEKGVGKSRNKALMFSDADICLIGDDDVVYIEDLENIIVSEFIKYTDADAIIFNINFIGNTTVKRKPHKFGKLNRLNFMGHGGPKIAFRRDKILENNIFFSLLFGGGSKYGSGEDSLFIKNMIDKNLKIYRSEKFIGTIDESKTESTWFNGFNQKYLYDRGALFRILFPKVWMLMILQFAIRHNSKFEKLNIVEILKIMYKGAIGYFEGKT